jgi:alpha-ketoglutarate-dependent taurine dioxygenase
MTLGFTPVSPALGVQVDIDPRRELDDAEQAELRALFGEHHLLLFRGHELSFEDQIRVCGYIAHVLRQDGVVPESYVSTPRGDAVLPDVEIPWHGDMNFNETPHLGASLYAEEIDELSSPTWYANSQRALEQLPASLRAELEGIDVIHEWPGTPEDPGFHPDVVTYHPLVWTHPITGRQFLYISERQSRQERLLAGVDLETERRLVQNVFDALYATDNVYEHRWKEHDFVIWDNLVLQHRRETIAGRRTLRRIALVIDEAAGQGDQYHTFQSTMRARRLAKSSAT